MFIDLKKQVRGNFDKLSKHNLFYVDVDRDEVVQKYLNGFEDYSRQNHNCSFCKSFLRKYAGVVAIIDGKKVSIWDNIVTDVEYQKSVNNLAKYIHSLPITNVFLNKFSKCGTDKNKDKLNGVTWNHFYFELPSKFVNNKNIDLVKGKAKTNKETLIRSLESLTIISTETVLKLKPYFSKEFVVELEGFLSLQKEYKLTEDKEDFCWLKSTQISERACNIIGTSIEAMSIDMLANKITLDNTFNEFEVYSKKINKMINEIEAKE